jgi:probable HAF family extracellular repeat protein
MGWGDDDYAPRGERAAALGKGVEMRLKLGLVALLALGAALSTAVQKYHLTDLGTLPGGSESVVNSVNVSGQAVGASTIADGDTHAFLYAGGSMTDLGTLGGAFSTALWVNAPGAVVGQSSLFGDHSFHAFLYSSGAMTDLGTLGGTWSVGWAINDSGQVAGSAATAGRAQHAFLYSGGVMTDLGTLGATSSEGLAVNDSGQVVGDSSTTDGAFHAFLYSAGVMSDLGTLGGTYSMAVGINAWGQAVGWANTSGDATFHAVLYSSGAVTDLGALDGVCSAANGINDAGQVVGSYSSTLDFSSTRPFVYSAGVMLDLNDLLDASGVGYAVLTADSISNNGTIAATGTTPSGEYHALLLTPLPQNGLTNINAVPGSTGAVVTWNSSVASTSEVDWGTTTSYGGVITSSVMTESHSMTITGLKPGTLYHYRVSSTDAYGNKVTSCDQTFVTGGSTTGGNGQFSTTITKLPGGGYNVAGTFTYTGGETMFWTYLVDVSLGAANLQPDISFGTLYNVGTTVPFSLTFPASAGTSGSTVLLKYQIQYTSMSNLVQIVTINGNYRIKLP